MKRGKILAVLSMFLLLLVVGGCGKKEFTITFNTAGGSKIESVTVKKDGKLEEPDEPTRKGYTFAGWEYDGEEFDFDTKITKDMTLKATWKSVVEKYTVTFDTNGGNEIDSVRVKKNEKVAEPTSPVKSGYTFVRWELNGVAFDFDSAITKDVTLVAVWAPVVAPVAKPSIKAEDLKTLQDLKNQVKELVKADYTEQSWNLLNVSLNLKETTQKEVTIKIEAIKDAISKLIWKELGALNDAKAKVEALVETEYTSASWSSYESALLVAEALPESTRSEMDAKATAYVAAMTNLELTGKANLDAKKSEISALVESDYTAASWTEFMTLKATAEAMPEATNKQIQDKIEAYNAAKDQLLLTEEAELIIWKALVAELDSNDFTALSWSSFQSQLTIVESMPETKKSEMSAKAQAYEAAFNLLEFLNQQDYEDKLLEINGLTESDYTAASWLVFENTMDEIMDIPFITNDGLLAVIAKMDEAMALLVYQVEVDLTEVETLISSLVESEYTSASWAQAQTALTTAAGMPDTTKALMDSKYAAYIAALDQLELTNKSTLTTKEAEIGSLVQGDYTVASWATFQANLVLVQNMPAYTSAQLTAKVNACDSIMQGLVLQAEVDLDAIKEKISGLTEADYTALSWTAYEGKLATAEAMPETNKSEMTLKIAAYQEAIDELVLQVKADLDAIKLDAASYQQADYTVASWTEFQTALTTASNLPEVTSEEMQVKLTAYSEAIAKLVAN